jgi:hypothetical protein
LSYDTKVPFEAFLPNLTQYVPDVPELVALNAVRNAAIEFCERTLIWQFDVDAMLAIKDVSTYEIDASAGVKFVDVMFGYYDDKLLVPRATDELTRLFRWKDWRTMKGEPAYITRLTAKEVIVVPTPDKAGPKISVRAAFAPTRDASGVGVDVFENYVEIVCHGARARLYNTPGQPYYDKNSALEFDRRFRAGISEVRVMVNKSLTRSSPKVEFQRIV